jgi:hypothetical protein
MNLVDRFRPPSAEADARETLEWVRRMEVVSGIGCIAFGLAYWGDGWWSWALLGVGVVAISRWGGARTILRKAERDPSVLIDDPEQRRVRGRRAVVAMVPLYALFGGVVGYLVEGWGMAAFMAALVGGAAALGAWWSIRRWR